MTPKLLIKERTPVFVLPHRGERLLLCPAVVPSAEQVLFHCHPGDDHPHAYFDSSIVTHHDHPSGHHDHSHSRSILKRHELAAGDYDESDHCHYTLPYELGRLIHPLLALAVWLVWLLSDLDLDEPFSLPYSHSARAPPLHC